MPARKKNDVAAGLALLVEDLRSEFRVFGEALQRQSEKLEDTRKHFTGRFDRMDARFDRMDARFDRMEARFDRMDARFDRIDARFDAADARSDAADARIAR